MSDATPVLVLHGVGNRGKQAAFEEEVHTLDQSVPGVARLIPVYWGDFAADPAHLNPTLPSVSDSSDVRDEALLPTTAPSTSTLVRHDTAADQRATIVANAATVRYAVRADATDVNPEDIRAAIHDTWNQLEFLPLLDDADVLRIVGESVSDALARTPLDGANPEPRFATRSASGAVETRGPINRARTICAAVLHGIDHAIGYTMGELGGRLNRVLRADFAPKIAGFFGDVIAYLDERRDGIRQRIFDVMTENAPGFGTADRPIGAIGHSLGGVILFDLAVDTEPLHLSTLITFGSQAPFFHAISRRSQLLSPFDGAHLVRVPDTIQHWINLWEPLDLLAFVAAHVFDLADGSKPDDREVAHDASEPLWTHSVYWTRPELRAAISDAFRDG